MDVKQITRNVLGSIGLLSAIRSVRRDLRRLPAVRRQDTYLRQLISVYRNPLSRPFSQIRPWFELQYQQQAEAGRLRFETDRAMLARKLALQVLETESAPSGVQRSPEEVVRAVGACCAEVPSHRPEPLPSVLRAIAALCSDDSEPDPGGLAERLARVLESSCGAVAPGVNGNGGRPTADAPGTLDRAGLVRLVLDRVTEGDLFPHAYEYDFLDDIVGIVRSRYVGRDGPHPERGRQMLRALCALAAGDPALDWGDLPGQLRGLLGEDHPYAPRRGAPQPRLREIIPDLYEELLAVRGRSDPRRYLEINRAYSKRQYDAYGTWQAELSLLLGYERDHHLMLRTLVNLIEDREITAADDVLVIGPRHCDEIHFFRNHLGLPRTIGLDLFAQEMHGIEAGDMHAMHYASNRFRLVFTCSTLCYSYDVRRVIHEIARVLKRPGYVIISDVAGRYAGPDGMARTDVRSADALIGSFYDYPFTLFFSDRGRSHDVKVARDWPSVGLRLD